MADLVIIGDSISAPSDAEAWLEGQGYGALIAQRSGRAEVNLAQSGAKVADMAAQWGAAIVRQPRPAGIVAMVGSNDIQAQTPLAQFALGVRSGVAAAVDAGLPVVLLTTFPRQIPAAWLASAAPYVQAVRAVAAAYRVTLIDVFARAAEWSITRSPADYASLFYTGDGINAHPTAAGQQMIAAMFQEPQAMGAPGYAPPVAVGWSYTDKSAGIAISSDAFTASASAADVAVRSAVAVTSGKRYAEILQVSGGSTVVLGVARPSAVLDYPGADGDGWGYFSANGKKIHANALAAFGPSYGDGSRVRVAYDADAGKVWFGIVGQPWPAGGNPECGESPAFSGLSGPVHLMFGTANPGSIKVELNAGQAAFAAQPAGFVAWSA